MAQKYDDMTVEALRAELHKRDRNEGTMRRKYEKKKKENIKLDKDNKDLIAKNETIMTDARAEVEKEINKLKHEVFVKGNKITNMGVTIRQAQEAVIDIEEVMDGLNNLRIAELNFSQMLLKKHKSFYVEVDNKGDDD